MRVLAVLAALHASTVVAWWDPAWHGRITLRVDNSSQALNLSNFPVLVALDPAKVPTARVQSTGADLRFVDADDSTVLPYEIESFNASGSSYIWVRVPQIDASSSTDFIYVYFDNPSATAAQTPTQVWTGGFRTVWHMGDNPAGTAPQVRDSSGNAFHGTTFGAPSAADSVQGAIGKGQRFDGVNDYVSGSINGLPSTAYTFEAWFRLNGSTVNEAHLIDFLNPTVQFFVESNDKLECGDSVEFSINGPTTCAQGTWYYAAMVVTPSGWTMYLNGVQEASGSGQMPPGTTFRLGVMDDLSKGFFPGVLDELRISTVSRPAAWIAAQYKSMNGSWSTYGVVQDGPVVDAGMPPVDAGAVDAGAADAGAVTPPGMGPDAGELGDAGAGNSPSGTGVDPGALPDALEHGFYTVGCDCGSLASGPDLVLCLATLALIVRRKRARS